MKTKKGKIKFSITMIVLLAVCLFFGKLFLSRKPFFVFGRAAFVISSASMEPEFPVNSIVVIKRTDFSTLEVGDVIAFRSNALGGKLAFHRIISKTEQGVYTKGDNSNLADNQLITSESYVGKGSIRITIFARYISTIKNPQGFILFFVLPIAAFAGCGFAIGLLKKHKENK